MYEWLVVLTAIDSRGQLEEREVQLEAGDIVMAMINGRAQMDEISRDEDWVSCVFQTRRLN